MISVKNTGAVGDGIADDTAAIQKALSSNQKVLFPAGRYVVSQSLDLRGLSNLEILGETRDTVTIVCTGALNGSDPDRFNDVFNANNLTLPFGAYCENLTFHDLTIDCSAQGAAGVPPGAVSGYNLCAIECQNVDGVRFKRLRIINAFGNALVAASIDPRFQAAVQGAIAEDCEFVGCCGGILPSYGITGSVIQYGAMQGGAILRCRFLHSGGPATDTFNCYGITIAGNYFLGSKGTPHGAGQNINGIHSDFGLQASQILDNTLLEAGAILLVGSPIPTPYNGNVPTPGPLRCKFRGNDLYGAAVENVNLPHITLLLAEGNVVEGNSSFQAPVGAGFAQIDATKNIVGSNVVL